MIEKIGNWCAMQGYANTSEGNWHMSYNEIKKQFDVSNEWLQEHHEDIREIIDVHELILSETWDDVDENGNTKGFDMNFCWDADNE